MMGAGGRPTGLLAYETHRRAREPVGHGVKQRPAMTLAGARRRCRSTYRATWGMPIHGIHRVRAVFARFVVVVRARGPRSCGWYDAAGSPTGAPRGRHWAALAAGHRRATRPTSRWPCARCTTRPARPLRLLLDTGAGHALSLETTSDPRLHLPAPRPAPPTWGAASRGCIARAHWAGSPACDLGPLPPAHRAHLLPRLGTRCTTLHANVLPQRQRGLRAAASASIVVIDYPHQRLLAAVREPAFARAVRARHVRPRPAGHRPRLPPLPGAARDARLAGRRRRHCRTARSWLSYQAFLPVKRLLPHLT
ncbi:MAG: hypothetical protein WKG07_15965 [Hymenobacter sp.]